MANESLNDLAKNAEGLNSTYDNASNPSTNDTLGDIADNLGFGADFPNSSYNQGGNSIGLEGNMDRFATYDSTWEGYRRQRNEGHDDAIQIPSNMFVALSTHDFDLLAYRNNTKVWKNETLQFTVNAGQGNSVGCNAGDRIEVSRPVGQATGVEFDEGMMYMGWAGFAFATRRDRNSGATLFVVPLQDDTDVEVLYTTSDGLQTSLTSQITQTGMDAFTLNSVTSLTTTRNYFIYATKPVCCYVRLESSQNVNDSFQLYPMDQDAKYGAFSGGGHMFLTNNATQNRAGSNVTQQLFNRSSNSGTTTERNASSASPSVYTDISPGQTSAGFFAGPVQKVQAGQGCLLTAEQQADGNGSDMTSFVSKKAFGTIGSTVGGVSDWVCCIGESAMTVYHRDVNGRLKSTSTMAGSSTYSLYFKYFNSSIADNDIFEASSDFIMYYDSVKDDERVCYMGDTTLEMSSLYSTANMSGPYGDPSEACNQPQTPAEHYVITSFATSQQVFTNSACTTELSIGNEYYYNHDTNQTFQYTSWTPSSGGIENIQACGR